MRAIDDMRRPTERQTAQAQAQEVPRTVRLRRLAAARSELFSGARRPQTCGFRRRRAMLGDDLRNETSSSRWGSLVVPGSPPPTGSVVEALLAARRCCSFGHRHCRALRSNSPPRPSDTARIREAGRSDERR
jgi:hypothetical protein